MESKKLAKEMDRLYQRLVDGLDGVKEQIAKREDRLRVITAELSRLDGVDQVASLDMAAIAEQIRTELAVWPKSVERLVLTPAGVATERLYRWSVTVNYAKMLESVLVQRHSGRAPGLYTARHAARPPAATPRPGESGNPADRPLGLVTERRPEW